MSDKPLSGHGLISNTREVVSTYGEVGYVKYVTSYSCLCGKGFDGILFGKPQIMDAYSRHFFEVLGATFRD